MKTTFFYEMQRVIISQIDLNIFHIMHYDDMMRDEILFLLLLHTVCVLYIVETYLLLNKDMQFRFYILLRFDWFFVLCVVFGLCIIKLL